MDKSDGNVLARTGGNHAGKKTQREQDVDQQSGRGRNTAAEEPGASLRRGNQYQRDKGGNANALFNQGKY